MVGSEEPTHVVAHEKEQAVSRKGEDERKGAEIDVLDADEDEPVKSKEDAPVKPELPAGIAVPQGMHAVAIEQGFSSPPQGRQMTAPVINVPGVQNQMSSEGMPISNDMPHVTPHIAADATSAVPQPPPAAGSTGAAKTIAKSTDLGFQVPTGMMVVSKAPLQVPGKNFIELPAEPLPGGM